MKKPVLLIGIVYFQIVFGNFLEDQLPVPDRECLAELNVPASELISTFHEDWTMDEGNEDVNNVILCANRKLQLRNEDDNLDFDKLQNYMLTNFINTANMKFNNAKDVVTSAIGGCKNIEGSTKGDILVKTYNYIVKYLRSQEL